MRWLRFAKWSRSALTCLCFANSGTVFMSDWLCFMGARNRDVVKLASFGAISAIPMVPVWRYNRFKAQMWHRSRYVRPRSWLRSAHLVDRPRLTSSRSPRSSLQARSAPAARLAAIVVNVARNATHHNHRRCARENLNVFRWISVNPNQVENQLGEQIAFLHLDCLCNDVCLNVNFERTLTVLADVLYHRLADFRRSITAGVAAQFNFGRDNLE
jgi:hypothetical protein